jgi:hypothetical protein
VVRNPAHEEHNQQDVEKTASQAISPLRPTGWLKLIPSNICSRSSSKMAGWRRRVFLNAGLVTAVLITNITATIWASSSYGTDGEFGIRIMYRGSCAKTQSMSMWLHFIINFLSTAML